jgi:hypothetical protein
MNPISKVTTVLGCATNGITDIIRLGLYFRGVSRNLFRGIKCFDEIFGRKLFKIKFNFARTLSPEYIPPRLGYYPTGSDWFSSITHINWFDSSITLAPAGQQICTVQHSQTMSKV